VQQQWDWVALWRPGLILLLMLAWHLIHNLRMKLADSYIDAQEGALLAQDAIAEWLDRYRLELDSQAEQVVYEGILDSLERADLIERK
tara:strand:- start:28 stop:291 length:264 start_codon:yes stop_codon:yes gene_type:complete